MAIWPQLGLNIWLDPNLKDFIATKQQSVVPTKQPTQSIPQKAMQSYNVKPKNPSSNYAWLERDEWDYIDSKLDEVWLSWSDRQLAKEQIYKTAIQTKQSRAFLRDRESMRQKIVSGEMNVWDKETADKIYKSSQFADMIREGALSSGKKDVTKIDDDTIINNVLSQKPELELMYNDFLAWNIDSVDLDYKLKWQERPKSIGNHIKDIWEWVVWFAWGIPKIVAEIWVLDKPMQKLGEKIGGVIWKDFNPQQSFSESAWWSQVWWDPESKTAKRVEFWLDALELATWVAALKSWAKFAAKQWLKKAVTESIETWWKKAIKVGKLDKSGKKTLELIAESDKWKSLKSALSRWWLEEWWSKVKRFWLWSWKLVKPSQKSIDAAATISTEIPKASKKPWKLFTQVSDKIWELSTNLWGKLKQVKIWTRTSDKKTLIDSLKTLATETKDFSPTIYKEVNRAISWIKKAKNLDEVRQSAKTLDAMIPESVKKWIWDKSAILNKLWRWSRDTLNDFMDVVATSSNSDAAVKQSFKKMTNLYHALWQLEENIPTLLKANKWFIPKTAWFLKEALKYSVWTAVWAAVINKATWR